jgi:aminoglycoside 2''-phosphotransferase
MPPSLPTDSERVRQVMPGLEISSLRAGEDGLVNDVLIVNEELVFRFARGEAGGRALAREARLLAFIGPRVSLRIPEVLEQREGCLVCRFIPGVPLDRALLLAQDAPARRALLEQIGTFLQQLHRLPLEAAGSITAREASTDMRQEYQQLYEAAERELFPSMMSWARAWARELLRPAVDGSLDLGYAPAIIHGDLAPYHLCFDSATRRLNGIIDFGNAGAGDPALDVGSVILAFGESQLGPVQSVYPGLTGLLDRARLHAAALELRWALAAIRSRDPAWFLCHLAYARDVWPAGGAT